MMDIGYCCFASLCQVARANLRNTGQRNAKAASDRPSHITLAPYQVRKIQVVGSIIRVKLKPHNTVSVGNR